MSTPPTWSASADWIIRVDGPPIRNGVLAGRGAVIEYVGPEADAPPTVDHRRLENAAILPGLVNTHTHLELTGLRGQLQPGPLMGDWIVALVRNRLSSPDLEGSVARGAAEAVATGTTALADTSHDNVAWRVLKRSPLRKLCLAEVTGIGTRARPAMAQLRHRLREIRPDERLAFGITPHAPYSTAERVYRQAVSLARRRGCGISTHLAETLEEREFLMSGEGMFFGLLARLGLGNSILGVPACTPLEFARRVGLLDGPCILAHVNYLDDDEMAILAASRASVAYCPRSSDFFGRTGHRYPEMLAAGVNVALGTDSLASNSSLEMLEEMRRVRRDAQVDNPTILRMATLNGARALGWDSIIGSLAPGKQADWIALSLPQETSDPLETILTTGAKVLQTVIGGQTAFA